ncbi:MAG: ABC transporter permease [Flavobacteriales bacterium]|jgi:lipopolysaccharide transport system permease protein|nr:ABC transporter permease [Flavobacteriales bacterium]
MPTERPTDLPSIVHTPRSAVRSPGALVRAMAADLRAARPLAWRLAVRDIRAQYRQSYLGYLWAFILPLANTVVWIMLNSSGVVRLQDTGIPYPAYVFTGTMVWQLLVEAVQSPLQEVGAARSYLTKLRFPREALILSGVLKQLFNMAIKLVILVPAVMLLGVMPDWHLLLAPVALLAVIITGLALGLLIAPVGMLYTDVARVVPLFAQFFMYVTPVVFAMPAAGTMARIFELNPATPLVLTARAWLTGDASPMLMPFLAVTAGAVVLLFFGLLLYRLALPVLIERLSQ